jgi:hypothetical protein
MELALVFGVLSAVGAATIAHAKGRSVVGWAICGLCIGVFAFVVAALPSREGIDQRAARTYGMAVGGFRLCPTCAEAVRVEARKCRFCQSPLS